MNPSLFLFDDDVARAWEPFSLTRPLGELLFGALLLRKRAERSWRAPCSAHISGEGMAGFSEPGSPPVRMRSSLPQSGVRILQSSRAVLRERPPELPGEEATLYVRDQVVGWIVGPGNPLPDPEALANPEPLPRSRPISLEGVVLENPWDLIRLNLAWLEEDIPRLFPGYAAEELQGSHILGTGLLTLGSRVEVEPGSVFDLRSGPIRLSDDVVVRSHTRLAGPAFVGPGTTILGGSLSGVSIGPGCKVRGEMEETVILGYSNKAHDGFLGHSYVGRWVNLGAFTTNSDLKNDYGPVRVGTASGTRDTGLTKMGCFLGDHVKTGIGTLLTTGTVVGAGSNLFGGAMPPPYVPPFSWGSGTELTEFRLEKFLEVARAVMARRDQSLEPGMEALLRGAWETAHARRAAV